MQVDVDHCDLCGGIGGYFHAELGWWPMHLRSCPNHYQNRPPIVPCGRPETHWMYGINLAGVAENTRRDPGHVYGVDKVYGGER